MEFVPLWETERRDTHRYISMGILVLWLMTFVMNGIALYIYSGMGNIAAEYRVRTLLFLQAKILLVQAISGILWFAVSLYIFLSALFIEEREKYNIASGVMFLISGTAELVIAIFLLIIRNRLLYVAYRLPLISMDELRAFILEINKTLIPLSLAANIVISLSIGLAFIMLGLGIRKYAWKLENKLLGITYSQFPPYVPEGTSEASTSQIHPMYTPLISRIRQGIKKMYSGGTMYLLSGVFDIIGIFIPFMGFLAFIFFIIGMVQISAGRRMIEEGRRQYILSQQLETSRKYEGELV